MVFLKADDPIDIISNMMDSYPLKLVIPLANKFANDKQLNTYEFSAINAISLLQKLGFEIIRKSDKSEVQNTIEDEEQIGDTLREKIRLPDLDLKNFIHNVDINGISSFESKPLPASEKVTISEIVKKCADGKWVLPKFQRYFDWKKKNIKEF